MLSELDRTHFLDILESAEEISTYVVGMDLEGYRSNRTVNLVVERLLQILTEAAIRLGDSAEFYCPEINWRELRGQGNFIRHVYHRIDPEYIWKTVSDRLPPLKDAARRVLAENPRQPTPDAESSS